MSNTIIDTPLDKGSKEGSLNHAFIQAQLTGFLFSDERFRVLTELSLDASQTDLSTFQLKSKKELIPDICLYSKTMQRQRRDVMRVQEMPLLVIEIVSPQQAIEEILIKFDAYFALGVQSCWLVVPNIELIDIYSQPDEHRTFDMADSEMFDKILDIHLPMQSIFI